MGTPTVGDQMLTGAQQRVLDTLVEQQAQLVAAATDSILRDAARLRDQRGLARRGNRSAGLGAHRRVRAVRARRIGARPDELSFIGETVERRIDQGIPAEQILDAYRVAHRVLWELIEESSTRVGADEGVIASLALPMMRYTEAAWSEIARSYIGAERRLAADLDRGQSRLVEAMIDGRSASEDLRLQAGSFPVGASEIYLVMVLRGFPDHAVGALRSAARRLGDGRLVRASIAHVRDDDLISILVLARDDPSAASERVAAEMAAAAGKLGCAPALGIGLRSCGPEQVDESYREARAAAAAAGAGGQLLLAKLSLASRLTLMVASGAVPERLIPDRVRAFIDEDRDGHGQLIETLREYAACDLNARRAATALFVHRNTVLYRLQRIDELSGLDPHALPELVDLIAAVRLTEGAQATAAAIARPATRPENRAAAEERPLQRTVAVHAAAAEAGDLAGGVQAGERLPVDAEHLRREVGVQAAERLAREDVQLDRDQRTGVGIEQRVRRGDSREAVGQVAAGAANRGDLHVLAVRVDHLTVARDHLALDLLEGQQRLRRSARSCPRRASRRSRRTTKSAPCRLNASTGARRAAAEPRLEHARARCAGDVGVLLGARQRELLAR